MNPGPDPENQNVVDPNLNPDPHCKEVIQNMDSLIALNKNYFEK